MNLSVFVARLGVKGAARRIGVTAKTIKRWLVDGVSYRWQPFVAAKIAAHNRAQKGAETRKRKQLEARGLVAPDVAYEDLVNRTGQLTDSQVTPTVTPDGTKESKDAIKREGIKSDGSVTVIETRRSTGETHWMHVGLSVLLVNLNTIVDEAARIWKSSGRDYVSLKFIVFRFIPWNPIYKGEMIKKQGQWVGDTMYTAAVASSRRLLDYASALFMQLESWAFSRVIYLDMVGVNVFDRNYEHDDLKGITNQPLRAS